MLQSGIYEILNTVNGKRYIGSAVNLRRREGEHKRELRRNDHSNPALQRAWDKYGAASFTFSTLLICARKDLLDYEQRCLDGFSPEYNIAKDARAPFAGRKHTPESAARIGASNKGKIISPEAAAHHAAVMRGRKLTPEHKAKVTASLLGNTRKLGKRSGPQSAEHRSKIAVALREFHSRSSA